jgi:flagellar biosynthetic protein FliP
VSRWPARALATAVVAGSLVFFGGGAAHAAPSGSPSPTPTPSASSSAPSVTIDLPGTSGSGSAPNSSILLVLALTLLAVAPAILLLCTSFTKIIVVLSLTRNALGLQGVPPNQVLAGLALFLSLFVMGPVLSQVNDQALQPYLKGDMTFSQAVTTGEEPMKQFMLKNTRPEELALMVKVSKQPAPATKNDVTITTLIPAFILSELRAAFIIGFVIFVPFLVIDMVVAAGLMSVGMMMMPPVMVSLPFKLLLFVLVNGWGLVVTALVSSYQ